MLSRRGFLGGLLAAPAIVRASSLMRVFPVRPWEVVITEISRVDYAYDALGQLRIIAWKEYEVPNWMFSARIEASSANALDFAPPL